MALVWTWVNGINSLSAPIDWEALHEIKDNVDDVNGRLGPAPVDFTFGGPVGTAVTVADQGGTTYLPIAGALADTGGALGDIWYTIISATQFTVHNAGSFRGAGRVKVIL